MFELYALDSKGLQRVQGDALQVFEAAERHGFFGFFETILCKDGCPILLIEHAKRLEHSCTSFSIPVPDFTEISSCIREFALRNAKKGLSVVRVRVYRTGERVSHMSLNLKDYPYAETMELEPCKLKVASTRRSRGSFLWKHKTNGRAELEQLREEAIREGFDDALILEFSDYVLETTRANVFALVGEEWVTPPADLGLLGGVVRNFLLNSGLEGFRFREAPLKFEDLTRAREVLITNSLVLARPVMQVGGFSQYSVSEGSKIRKKLWEVLLERTNS